MKKRRAMSRNYDSPPPYIRIPAGQCRRPSSPDVPPGYVPCEPIMLPRYGSLTAEVMPQCPPDVCPACRIGKVETEYNCWSICCILFCCPLFATTVRRCNNCGACFQ